MLSVNEVRDRIEGLRDEFQAGNHGNCQMLKDRLWEDVLIAIASQDDESGRLAMEALEVMAIEFEPCYQ